jgi:hypothetical protein
LWRGANFPKGVDKMAASSTCENCGVDFGYPDGLAVHKELGATETETRPNTVGLARTRRGFGIAPSATQDERLVRRGTRPPQPTDSIWGDGRSRHVRRSE